MLRKWIFDISDIDDISEHDFLMDCASNLLALALHANHLIEALSAGDVATFLKLGEQEMPLSVAESAVDAVLAAVKESQLSPAYVDPVKVQKEATKYQTLAERLLGLKYKPYFSDAVVHFNAIATTMQRMHITYNILESHSVNASSFIPLGTVLSVRDQCL